MLPTSNAQHTHTARVSKRWKEFGCDEEVLGPWRFVAGITIDGHRVETSRGVAILFFVVWRSGERGVTAGDADHPAVNEALIAGIHALVDFIDDTKGGAGEGL